MLLRQNIHSIISKKAILLGFFWFSILSLTAQNQIKSDSLELIYNEGNFDDSEELNLLKQLADNETNADKKLNFSSELIIAAKSKDSGSYEYSGYLQKGNAYQMKGDLTKALENYIEAAKTADNYALEDEKGVINISIADVYSEMEDNTTAMLYYRKALNEMGEHLENADDSLNLASLQLNLGDEYINQKKLDSALYLSQESQKIFGAKPEWEPYEAYSLGNIGLIYAELEDLENAESNLNKAIEVMTEYGDYQPICVYLNAMSDVFENKGNKAKSVEYAKKSLDIAKQFGLKDEIGEANFRLYDIYKRRRNFKDALEFYETYHTYNDSVRNISDVQKSAKELKDFEVGLKQKELELIDEKRKTQKIILYAVIAVLLLIAFLARSLFKSNKYIKKTNEVIAHEKERSEKLLLNILPEETAHELKEKGKVEAKKFDDVTILFTDFKGFTSQSEKLSPEDVVKSIDHYFAEFDAITEKYGLEKIKTIGDAYMCAGSLPHPLEDHAAKVCQAGLEMAEFVKKTKRSINHKLAKFDIRIGVNTGAVVAGVVGTKKFQYDIWGDAVNTAARMESSSEIGRVNISQSTKKALEKYDVFEFTERGALEAKGKGKIDMFFVDYVG
ncbi:adenylate/guanylate cyclase domain-containing protein [Ichthyenterobacterium sp. W332]|uniref:Adenylate/guanylate cyclase domain-containing protein n=1 Tax=Microcosmobacter mediterraneus TaxID=3075607 RepID=A0ABU2YLQ0_9FLAO|nr:adenylate/guanylate cyclase domain-containing protein [Ichthyenterobacterium sp. W332]MDT0558836.1 adenylate/guanylate cyclase domain-containing protein [Ichthyenterobacterium sp. W332]